MNLRSEHVREMYGLPNRVKGRRGIDVKPIDKFNLERLHIRFLDHRLPRALHELGKS